MVQSKQKNVKPGDVIKIPLPDGSHIYARVLVDDSYAFYDAKQKMILKISQPLLIAQFYLWLG
jgi:hypothetical protein